MDYAVLLDSAYFEHSILFFKIIIYNVVHNSNAKDFLLLFFISGKTFLSINASQNVLGLHGHGRMLDINSKWSYKYVPCSVRYCSRLSIHF